MVEDGTCADLFEHRRKPVRGRTCAKCEKASDRDRKYRIPPNSLRRIPDLQARHSLDSAAVRLNDPQQRSDQRRFSGTVKPNKVDSLTGMDFSIDRLEHVALPRANADLPGFDQWLTALSHCQPSPLRVRKPLTETCQSAPGHSPED